MKPTFEVCTTDGDPYFRSSLLTVDRRSELRPRYFENEPDFRPMRTKSERLLSKSLRTLEVMTYYLVVHTGPVQEISLAWYWDMKQSRNIVCLCVGWFA